jgi:outer membrane protein OmpA-like peptidoglycan-associated protein
MKTLLASLILALAATPALAAPDFVGKPARPTSNLSASESTKLIAPDDDVTFAHNSVSLTIAATDQIDSAAKWLIKHPKHAVVVEGYADHTGQQAYNMNLSIRRAAAVRDRFIEMGIDPDRIVVAAYGEKKASNDASSLDRRVVFFTTNRPISEIVTGTLHARNAASVTYMQGNTLKTERRGGSTTQIATR